MPYGITEPEDTAFAPAGINSAEINGATVASSSEYDVASCAEIGEVRAHIQTTISEHGKRRAHVAGIMFWLVVWLVLYFPFLSHALPREGMSFTLVSLALPALTLPLLIILIRRENWKNTRKSIAIIEAMDDVRYIGSLIEMLKIDSVPVRNAAKARLVHLLPQLESSDAVLLDPIQRKRLNSSIGAHLFNFAYRDVVELGAKGMRQRETDFQIAVINTCEHIGDVACLPVVRSLAEPRTHHVNIVPTEVSEAARHCLAFLEPMIAQDTASKQLLRPSSASDVMTDTLLRPAMHQTDSDAADTLLRAADA